jgi:hypothetical protein
MVLPMKRRVVPSIDDEDVADDVKGQQVQKGSKAGVYRVVEVPTQMELAIENSRTGEQFNALSILCKIADDVDEIKKSL